MDRNHTQPSPRQPSLVCTTMFVVLSLPLGQLALGQGLAHVDRAYTLPCDVTSFAQSGDGTIIWFACQDRSLWKRWESEAAEARKKNQTPPMPPATTQSRTAVYALEVQSSRVTELADAEGSIQIVAAPVGARMVLVLPQERGHGRPVLYDGTRQVTELSIDPFFLLWSADASKIYFYGGTMIESEAWNILGVLRLDGLVVSREKLLEATEDVHICAANGHLFTGEPFVNNKGELEELEVNTVEYDPDLKSSRRITKFLPGNFSASCRYVATEQSFHGPLPGEIVEVATGQRMRFEFTGEGKKVEFEFHSWNPKRDDIFLRLVDLPMDSKTGVSHVVVQVFQMGQQRPLESFNDIPGNVAWSNDGRSLVFSRARTLIVRSIFKENEKISFQ